VVGNRDVQAFDPDLRRVQAQHADDSQQDQIHLHGDQEFAAEGQFHR
jgi:hypothetical protein